jgi:hypothetical protein
VSEQAIGWVQLGARAKKLHLFWGCYEPSTVATYSLCDKYRILARDWPGFVPNPPPENCCKACERMQGVYKRRDAKARRP